MTSEDFLWHLGRWRTVLWPEFVEYKGCIFRGPLSDSAKKAYEDWMAQTGGDLLRVEAVMNHLHIADVLEGTVADPSHEAILTFGRLMRDLWTQKLSIDFPNRRLIVSFPEDYRDDVVDYQITFHQEA